MFGPAPLFDAAPTVADPSAPAVAAGAGKAGPSSREAVRLSEEAQEFAGHIQPGLRRTRNTAPPVFSRGTVARSSSADALRRPLSEGICGSSGVSSALQNSGPPPLGQSSILVIHEPPLPWLVAADDLHTTNCALKAFVLWRNLARLRIVRQSDAGRRATAHDTELAQMLYALGVAPELAESFDRRHVTVAAMAQYVDHAEAVVDLRQMGIVVPAPTVRQLYALAKTSVAAKSAQAAPSLAPPAAKPRAQSPHKQRKRSPATRRPTAPTMPAEAPPKSAGGALRLP